MLYIANGKYADVERVMCDDFRDEIGWHSKTIEDQGLDIFENVLPS